MNSVTTTCRAALLAACSVLALGAAQAGAEQAASGQATTSTTTTTKTTRQPGTATSPVVPHPLVMVLMPAEVAAQENAVKQGCWAKIWDRENYAGDSLTLAGPVAVANMSGPFGLNWDDKVNSIETGSKTTVTVYDNAAYRDQVAQFKPGQKVADVSKKLGFFDEFASIKLECAR